MLRARRWSVPPHRSTLKTQKAPGKFRALFAFFVIADVIADNGALPAGPFP